MNTVYFKIKAIMDSKYYYTEESVYAVNLRACTIILCPVYTIQVESIFKIESDFIIMLAYHVRYIIITFVLETVWRDQFSVQIERIIMLKTTGLPFITS